MKYLVLLVFLASCSGTDQSVKNLLDRLEFDEDESGCLRLTANVDLNPIPLITSNATLVYKKQKGEGDFTC